MALPRFVFLVHPLTFNQRRVVGVRTLQWGLYGNRHGREFRSGRICLLEMPGVARGEVISLPWMPSELIEDQASAVDKMAELVEDLEDVRAVGLGSLLAVVGSRGEALAQRTEVPITSGAAATTWAALKNTLSVLEATGETSVAMVGFSGTWGRLLVRRLEKLGGGLGWSQGEGGGSKSDLPWAEAFQRRGSGSGATNCGGCGYHGCRVGALDAGAPQHFAGCCSPEFVEEGQAA